MIDDLRDRIADELAGHQIWTGYYATNVGMDEAREMAQAIIDDLGLAVEERIDMPGRRGINPVHRVVGRWETGE